MSDSASFTNILNKPASEIERPKPMPTGTYLWLVEGQPRFDKAKQKQTPYVEFMLRCLQPMEDVDQQTVADMGGIAGKQQRLTFYLTEDSLFRLTNKNDDGFLDQLGIDKSNLGAMISEAPGRQVLGTIAHTASQDGTQVYANITKTAKV